MKGCVNGRLKCKSLGRLFVTDYCGRFNAYLVSQDERCADCKRSLKPEDILTRDGKPVYKPNSQGRPKKA